MTQAPRWQQSPQELNEPWRAWLLDRGSLVSRLQQVSGECCQVELCHQQLQAPFADEQEIIAEEGAMLIREVLIHCGDQVAVFARSVIPEIIFHQTRFQQLGPHGLGQVLFSDAAIVRGDIDVATINDKHDLFQRAALYMPVDFESANLRKGAEHEARNSCIHDLNQERWARRSLFTVGDHPLLISEVFLPHVATY